MKLWIVGTKGLVGSALLRICSQLDIPCVATGKEINIVDLETISAFAHSPVCKDITHIINCAAYTNVDGAEDYPEEAYKINALGPKNLSIIALRIAAKLIHLSTDYVFGDLTRTIPWQENDICNPLNIYGLTKLQGEQLAITANPSCCILRTSWVFGQGGKNFISALLNQISKTSTLTLATDQIGKITWVDDLAYAILQSLSLQGIFHFANEGAVTRYKVAEEILSHLNLKKELVATTSAHFTSKARRPLYSVLNTNKISKVLPTAPRPWQAALKDYLTHAI